MSKGLPSVFVLSPSGQIPRSHLPFAARQYPAMPRDLNALRLEKALSKIQEVMFELAGRLL